VPAATTTPERGPGKWWGVGRTGAMDSQGGGIIKNKNKKRDRVEEW